ncbi:MAG TPA: DUF2254 family protein [Vicinamibacterales bacterium]|nr:DUF2254 family protein [Vicinamibacterales bacterium]
MLRLDSRPGAFVRSGTPVVSVVLPFTPADDVEKSVRATFIIGAERTVRVVASAVTFAGMVDQAFTEIARYGRSSVSVSCRLLEAMRDLAPCLTREEDRLALVRQAAFVGDRPAVPFDNEMDRAALADCYRAALSALHRPHVFDPSQGMTSRSSHDAVTSIRQYPE